LGKSQDMRLPSLNRWHIIVTTIVLSAYSLTSCSKNSGPGNGIKNDSDTVLRRKTYDSAVFVANMSLDIAKTSGIFNDTFTDFASIIIYVVNGVVKIPHDSILNRAPFVYPTSGSSGSWSATWIPDKIGEINITDAAGLAIGDTTVVITLTQTGAVSPNWNVCFMGSCSPTGNAPSPGWPLAFSFNPKLKQQTPFKLDQPGSSWEIGVGKEY
jgi:hypothetical protein